MEPNNVKGFAKLTYRSMLEQLQKIPEEKLDGLAIIYDTGNEDFIFISRAVISESGKLYFEV